MIHIAKDKYIANKIFNPTNIKLIKGLHYINVKFKFFIANDSWKENFIIFIYGLPWWKVDEKIVIIS